MDGRGLDYSFTETLTSIFTSLKAMQMGGEFRFSQFDSRKKISVPTFYHNSPTVGWQTLSIRMSTHDLSPFPTVSGRLACKSRRVF